MSIEEENRSFGNGWHAYDKQSGKYAKTVYHRTRKNGRVTETITLEVTEASDEIAWYWDVTEQYSGPSDMWLEKRSEERFDELESAIDHVFYMMND